jgi:hypothetical protein
MAHHTDPELLNNVLQLLTEQGHDGRGFQARVGCAGRTPPAAENPTTTFHQGRSRQKTWSLRSLCSLL